MRLLLFPHNSTSSLFLLGSQLRHRFLFQPIVIILKRPSVFHLHHPSDIYPSLDSRATHACRDKPRITTRLFNLLQKSIQTDFSNSIAPICAYRTALARVQARPKSPSPTW